MTMSSKYHVFLIDAGGNRVAESSLYVNFAVLLRVVQRTNANPSARNKAGTDAHDIAKSIMLVLRLDTLPP